MARTFAMSTLVTRCKRRSDKEGESHISDPEWKALISEQYGELAQIIVDGGGRYFETESTIAATGAASYTEPSDILHILEITRVDGSYRRRLDELMLQERAGVMGLTGTAAFWEFSDDQIILYPKPSSGTYKCLYIPQPPDLSAYADGDLVDVACPAGERFLIWSVARTAKDKSESGYALCEREAEKAREGLQAWAATRAALNPRQRVTSEIGDRRYDPDGWERW